MAMMDTLKHNAGKLGLAAVLLIGAGIVYYSGGKGGIDRSDSIDYICVETGEIFTMSREPRLLPVENPDTKRKTLIPCYRKDDGQLAITGRVGEIIKDLDAQGLNHYVDVKTLAIKKE